ncbi:MAG: hypothetical protein WCY72_01130 [Lysobacteraceae bacterium]
MKPSPVDPRDDAIRHLAGSCYPALREEDAGHLDPSPPTDALEASGLSGMHANLCVRLGVPDTRAPCPRRSSARPGTRCSCWLRHSMLRAPNQIDH